MELSMGQWIENLRNEKHKKPLPLLSFPCVSLLKKSVGEIVVDSDAQAKGMKIIADKTEASASVSFMDLSVESECFGSKVIMNCDEVPTIKGRIINDIDAANALEIPLIGSCRTGTYIDAIKKAKKLITDRPIFAGMIGPFSLAARLLDVSEIMLDCYDEPEMVHIVLNKVTEFLINYAKAFKDAGSNGIVMAEPVAGLLSPSLEEEFSSHYVKKIVEAVQDDKFIVIYHNCGDNVPKMLDSIISIGCAAYHFGNAIDIENDILSKVPTEILIMGNIDPVGVLRLGTPGIVRKATLSLLEKCSKYTNFVLSSGCDIPPAVPWENIDAFFSANDEFYGK